MIPKLFQLGVNSRTIYFKKKKFKFNIKIQNLNQKTSETTCRETLREFSKPVKTVEAKNVKLVKGNIYIFYLKKCLNFFLV